MDRVRELDAFKSQINLVEYMASFGYQVDAQQSSHHSVTMRGENDDKLVVTKDSNGHYVYFSVRDQHDSGTIIDFHQHRRNDNVGEIRLALRPWLNNHAGIQRPPVQSTPSLVTATTPDKNRQAILLNLAKMHVSTNHPYLTHYRHISAKILSSRRFKNQIFIDNRHNAVFPHVDHEGVCGYEIKNRQFTGFSRHGIKAVWLSNAFETDQALVVTESAIDALSHYQLFRHEHTRYISLAGTWSADTDAILVSAVNHLPGKTVRLAFDHDEAGEALMKRTRKILEGTNKQIIDERPDERGMDWNAVLQKRVKIF